MRNISHFIIALFLALVWGSCSGQSKSSVRHVGGPCEGCEGLHEYGNKKLSTVDTLPLYHRTEPKLKITGRVFQKDGKTPAPDVIIYIYQTSRRGYYETKGDEVGWAKRHGYIRGWVKTDALGRYTFYTFRPAAYPDRSEPEHIHVTVKEPQTNAYYLDNYLFDDDPLLTPAKRKAATNRGGSGIAKLQLDEKILVLKRDIILGQNIPDYE